MKNIIQEMKRKKSYPRLWCRDWYSVFTQELKHIFSDSGVLIIFFLAGLAYPLLYGAIYSKGSVDDMPIAVVDNSCSRLSREFTRGLDATRELRVSCLCANMAEAESLLKGRKVKGIEMIPSDFGDRIVSGEQGTISTYADMSSFLYYKNLTMGVNMVMLDEMHRIQASRLA